jgi:hypothetical protein
VVIFLNNNNEALDSIKKEIPDQLHLLQWCKSRHCSYNECESVELLFLVQDGNDSDLSNFYIQTPERRWRESAEYFNHETACLVQE